MPRTKISEFSVTPGDNTDIDGINIAEGCAPSGINDAIRELMAQLKDFQSGAAGDSITVVGTLAAKGTSSSGADLKLYEDTDNGTNYVGFIAPASIASNVQWTLPSADGSSGQALQTNGSGTLSFATLGISAGGTGQTTANAAFNALAPSQTSNAGRYLKTDGTNTSWDLLDISTADITGTLPVANGGTGITSFGTGVATALGINVGSSGAFVTNGGALGTPSSGTVTNLTGTASININGTVGATTPNTGSFTTLTTSSTVTINGGTANGVAYLNGSKVLTTGSALTFNGTNFGLGGSADAWSGTYRALQVNGTVPVFGSQTQYIHVLSNAYNDGSWKYKVSSAAARYTQDIGVHYWDTAVVGTAGAALTWNEQMRLTSTGLGIGTSSPVYKLTTNVTGGSATALFKTDQATADIYLQASGTSQTYSVGIGASANALRFMSGTLGTTMLLDSSGNLGIGTSSPAYKLDVAGSVIRLINSGATADLFLTDSGTTNGYVRLRGESNAMKFITGNGVSATIDSSGNLGLGVTPSAWGSVSRAMQFQNGVSIFSNSSGLGGLGNNVYSNPGTADYYIATGFATRYYQFNGTHVWNTAASGNAGDTISFTQALTLHASGGLSLGNTTDPGATNLSVTGTITSGKGANVASASTVTLGAGNFFDITGTTTISNITIKPAGTVVYLKFDDSLTLQTGSIGSSGAMRLTNGASLGVSQYDVLTLISDGTNWWQVAYNNN